MAGADEASGMSGSAWERTREKLDRALSGGDAYSTLQLAQTLVRRAEKAGDAALSQRIMEETARSLLERMRATEEAASLITALQDSFEAAGPVSQGAVDRVLDLVALLPRETKHRLRVIERLVKWARAAPAAGSGLGLSAGAQLSLLRDLRSRAGAAASDLGLFHEAASHFILSEDPDAFGDMLARWARRGFPRERAVFLLRGALMLLARGNLRDANRTRTRFLAQFPELALSTEEPLLDFLRMVLVCLEYEAQPLFRILCRRYKTDIDAADSTLTPLLDATASKFFGTSSSTGSGSAGGGGGGGGGGGALAATSPMAAMMQSMMAGLGGRPGHGGGTVARAASAGALSRP